MARVLVVDDETDIRFLHRVVLESAGHHVFEAADGTDALDLARTTAIDLIISDLMMPSMTGAELISALREEPDLVRIPVILISADPGKPPTDGAAAIFRKPASITELLDTIQQLTSGA